MKHIEAGKPFQVAGDKIAVQLASYPTTLHYTVDAVQGWTDWSEQITEKNVVINNIPRGLFLKFDVDVTITY